MANVFVEKNFLEAVKNFTEAIKLWRSDNTAKNFLNEIVLHMDYSVNEVRRYLAELHWVLGKRIELKTVGDWRKLYKYVIDDNRDSAFATMLQCGHKFFKSPDRLEAYFDLMAEEVNTNPNIWKTRYFLHKIGGKEVVNTLCYVIENGITLEELCLSSEEVRDAVFIECTEVSGSEETLIDLTAEESVTDMEMNPIQSEMEMGLDRTNSTEDYEMDSTAPIADSHVELGTPIEMGETEIAEHTSVEVISLPEPVLSETKKETTTGKRGYNQAVAAYEPIADFSSLEEAEKSTGVPQGEIKRCIEGELQTAGGFVWRRKGKKKDRLSQFEHAATYNNLVDAENITGVNHSNISAVLKGKGNTAGGFVWIRVNCDRISSAASTTTDIAPKKECKIIKAHSPSDKVLVAYLLTEQEELDFTKGPIGIFKTQAEAAKELKMGNCTLSNYLAGRKRKLRWKKNESEKYWIGVRWETTSPLNPDTPHKSHKTFELIPQKTTYNSGNARSGLRPIVSWVGGKSRELKYIYRALPEYQRFFEPFVGGGSVFMGMNANEYFINDFSTDLISTYKAIGGSDEEFQRYLYDIESTLQKTVGFRDKYQEELYQIYLKSISENWEQKKLTGELYNFMEEHDSDIQNIVSEFSSLPCSLKNKLFAQLCKRFKTLKKKGVTELEEVKEYILTGIKAAVYYNYTDLFNTYSLKETNKPLYQALYVYFRQHARNAGCEYNKKGHFITSYGGYSQNYNSLKNKIEYYKSSPVQERFKKTHIFNLDFEEFLKQTNPGENDFIFLDPPYDSPFSNYENNEFGRQDHRRLADYLMESKARWMIVIEETDFIYKLYNREGIQIQSFPYKYTLNYNGLEKKTVNHLIITNYTTPKVGLNVVLRRNQYEKAQIAA